MKQNYFTSNEEFYCQEEGLAMGEPLSGLLADIYLNHFENQYIFKNNPYREKIIFYRRYVDDTFVVFNGTERQIKNFNNYMNNISSKINFTSEIEKNNEINFLDITITKNNEDFSYKIYRKPTTTDMTIHATSHHPI